MIKNQKSTELSKTELSKTESSKTESYKIEKLIKKYPDKVPIYVQVSQKEKNSIELNKNRYLVPKDLYASLFLQILKKKTNVEEHDSLYVFVNHNNEIIMLNLMKNCGELYRDYKNDDHLLHLTLCKENAFGS